MAINSPIDTEEVYRRYGPMVLRRCRKLLRDETAAVDAMQDTFVQLLRQKHRLNDRSLVSLLYVMATNTCLNILRSQRRHPTTPGDDLFGRIAGCEVHEERLLAANLIARLFSGEKASTRTMAVLHFLDGWTLAEVASQVNLSISGVRKRLAPLQKQLARLSGEGES